MSSIFAISLLTIRSAIRSKVVWCLLVLLMAILILLPLTIKGDGTVGGFIQVLISYTLGMAMFVLSLTTLWAGSAAISTDIQDKTIQMIAAKSVPRWHIWTGKWIGLNILNVGLLLMCGLVVFVSLQWHLQPSRWSAESLADARRILTAREVVTPQKPDFMVQARLQLDARLRNGPLPEDTTEGDALRMIQQQMLFEHYTVRPAGRKTWSMGVLANAAEQPTVTLQYIFSSSAIGQGMVEGQWWIGTENQPNILQLSRKSVPRTVNEFHITLDQRWENQPVILTYIETNRDGITLIFNPDNGITLLNPTGGFAGNFTRALLVLFGQLAFLAAIGVASGSLFSLPVAVAVSLFILFLVQMGSYIEGIAQHDVLPSGHTHSHSHSHDHEEVEDGMSWGTTLITITFKGLALMIRPLIQESALGHLSTGKLIDLAWTVKALILQGLLYSILLGWFSSHIMKNRELALPSS